MSVLDQINHKWGRGTLHPARLQPAPEWRMRQQLLSPAFTTQFYGLWQIAAT